MTAKPNTTGLPPQAAQISLFATFFGVFLLVMGLLTATFCLAFFYFTYQADEQAARFTREGRDASALVVRKWKQQTGGSSIGTGSSTSRSSGSTSYFLEVRYSPAQGSTRDSVAVVNSVSLWSGTKEGDKLDIRYLDALPEFVMLKKDDPDEPMEAEEWAILVGATVVFLLMAAASFWVRQRFRQIKQ